MSKPLYPGNTVNRTYTFKDENQALYDPTTINVTFKSPSGEVKGMLTLEQLIRDSLGVFRVRWNLPADAEAGTWQITVDATYAPTNLSDTRKFTFKVSAR